MIQKLAHITVYKKKEAVSVLVAPMYVHPTEYVTCPYKKDNKSFKDTLRLLGRDIVSGRFVFTEGCKENEKFIKVKIYEDEVLSNFEPVKKLIYGNIDFPSDLNNLIEKYKNEYYQILGDYLCVLLFHNQFPFKETEMASYTTTRISSLNDKLSPLFEKEISELSDINFNNRRNDLQNNYNLESVTEYLINNINKENDSVKKNYYAEKLIEINNITKSNIDDIERFLSNRFGLFEKEEEIESNRG